LAFPTDAYAAGEFLGVDGLNKINQHFADASQHVIAKNNMTDLKAMTTQQDGWLVWLLGYYTPEDGGGGLFRWNAYDSTADNGGTIIAKADGTRGRWHRLISGKAINVLWFGAKGDDTGDQSPAVNAASAFAKAGIVTAPDDTMKGGTIYFPPGTYRFVTAPICRAYTSWVGAGNDMTTLHWVSTGIFLDVNANIANVGLRFQLSELTLFGDQAAFELMRVRGVFSIKHHRVGFKGTHGDPARGLNGQQLNQVGIYLYDVAAGDNSWSQCRFYDLGVAVKAGDIGNTFTDCHVAYCYYAVSGDIAAGNCSTEWVNSTLNGGVNATYSRIAFFFPRRASRIHLVNCYIEGWETCVRMGTPGNPALGGPYSCGFINTKFAATDQCIMLAAARQTTIVNCIFQGVDGTIGANNVVPLYFPSGHAAIDGTCIQPMVGYAYKGLENGDLPVDIFPGRWTYHGRVQHKAGEDGIYLHGSMAIRTALRS
jgi:hypothetical protein